MHTIVKKSQNVKPI